MKTCKIQPTSLSSLKLACSCGLILILLGSAISIQAQNNTPQRGFHPAGSYAISDVETISMDNGNLTFQIPLVALPAGRGGHPGAKIGLYYNSKSLDGRAQIVGSVAKNILVPNQDVTWRYGFQHELKVDDRLDQYVGGYGGGCDDPELIYRFKLKMIFPDGAEREFRPAGYPNNNPLLDDYFDLFPSGWIVPGCGDPSVYTNNTITYYSTDGSYLRLDIEHDGDDAYLWNNNPWTLHYPDGTRVTGGNAPLRIYDRNNNYIEVQNIAYGGLPATKIVDQLGRYLIIAQDFDQDFIHMWGVNNEQVTYTVKWKNISVFKTYYPGPGLPQETLSAALKVVDQIILPAQTGSLAYTFGYNAGTQNPSYGYGEVSSLTLPSGTPPPLAQTNYQYQLDGANLLSYDTILGNQIIQKDLTYQREYDGSSTLATETWFYSIGPPGSPKTITGPDEGVFSTTGSPGSNGYWPDSQSMQFERTVYPDGKVVERIWKRNIPYGLPPNNKPINTYVKTEFTSLKNASGTLVKTAIKDYNYDKNGNVTQTAEYDWVDYSSVPGHPGLPTGIPGGLTPKRVTVNTYYNPTPDASDTTTDDEDVYHKPTSPPGSPRLRNAIESSETRSDTNPSSALSRSEYFYDNFSTTGNLIIERGWDSTKGPIGRPLDTCLPPASCNSISVRHEYDGYGNRRRTFDANGVQTEYQYGVISDGQGHFFNDLFVTAEISAYQTPVSRTISYGYDFQTGLRTRVTDTDNNIITRTTYDVFGRPTLVEEADGVVGVEKQTATEYSDTHRRVIVRADLNTTGDGKLITIQHYDQLGRVRLTRRLESGNPAEATDETKGVKIQTRYFAGDFGNQNSYDLVSAPYRAATSGAVSGEPGMAWKRLKFDKGGKVIELETFVGATLPAPWGSNSVSSGKFTTEYDAEFTTVTDQALKKRRSGVDGLGRSVRIDEPDAGGNLGSVTAPVQPTDYTYNPLGNLIQISQTGVPNGGSTPVTQNRYFNFSSLGRLISANNPESGLITYQYDANGNLTKKTDAYGIWIDYEYDQLNRNTTADYSNTSVDPDITRAYDAAPNGKGKLWHTYAGGHETPNTNEEYFEIGAYDKLGRPLSYSQWFKTGNTWTGDFTTSQTYDLAGHVKTKNYPSGRSVTYTYDVAGDLTSFTGNIGDGAPRTYSTGIQYNPQGQLIREQFGTSQALYHRRHYNSRGQLFDVRLGTDSNTINDGPNPAQWSQSSWNRGALRMYFSSNMIEYTWPAQAPQYNNGNLYRQDHFVPTALDGSGNPTVYATAVDYFGYDSLNRVTLAQEETYYSGGGYTPNVFKQEFSYDRFGNRRVSFSNVPDVPNPGYKINGANNRLIAPTDTDGSHTSNDKMRYDQAGNLIKDTHTQTGTTGNRTYDAENRMLTADGSNGLANSYVYDADGHRTRRSINNGGEIWWQVYGISGELAAEYQLVSGTPTLKKEYGYRNGQLLVIAETTGTCQWVVTDALGTPRMIADQTGSLAGMKRRDYLPFGEELLAGVGHRQTSNGYSAAQSQQPRQQFTGKERDSETGLDYFQARYYGSVYGRFTSPDEFTGGPDELYDFADNAGDNPLLYAEQGEPQSLNKYQYCYNNPLVYTNIDGHKGWDLLKTGLEIASWVPGPVGTVASIARAGIAVAEGDYKGALEHAAGAVPGGKLIGGAVKATAKALDKIGDAAKVVEKLKDVATTENIQWLRLPLTSSVALNAKLHT